MSFKSRGNIDFSYDLSVDDQEGLVLEKFRALSSAAGSSEYLWLLTSIFDVDRQMAPSPSAEITESG